MERLALFFWSFLAATVLSLEVGAVRSPCESQRRPDALVRSSRLRAEFRLDGFDGGEKSISAIEKTFGIADIVQFTPPPPPTRSMRGR